MSTPKAWLAASASSSPAASIGPDELAGYGYIKPELTSENDELASMFVCKSMLAFARQNMSDDEGDILGQLAQLPQ